MIGDHRETILAALRSSEDATQGQLDSYRVEFQGYNEITKGDVRFGYDNKTPRLILAELGEKLRRIRAASAWVEMQE